MAIAFKCDICGKHFDPIYDSKYGNMFRRLTIETKCCNAPDVLDMNYYEICDDCHKKIFELIKSIKEDKLSAQATELAKSVNDQCNNIRIIY